MKVVISATLKSCIQTIQNCLAYPRVMFVLHQRVALTHDIPDAGLQLGDLGAVVAIHNP